LTLFFLILRVYWITVSKPRIRRPNVLNILKQRAEDATLWIPRARSWCSSAHRRASPSTPGPCCPPSRSFWSGRPGPGTLSVGRRGRPGSSSSDLWGPPSASARLSPHAVVLQRGGWRLEQRVGGTCWTATSTGGRISPCCEPGAKSTRRLGHFMLRTGTWWTTATSGGNGRSD
jgi:hypothetical protein